MESKLHQVVFSVETKELQGIPPSARDILTYFVRNPAAADSLEGIARWRLLEQAIHRSLVETEDALDWLVEQGFLDEVRGSHRSALFRLNPKKQKQAESLLTGLGSGRSRKEGVSH